MQIQWDIAPFSKTRLNSFELGPPTQPSGDKFVLNKWWVLSYLRLRNSPLQKLLEEWIQALGATISGNLWVKVS